MNKYQEALDYIYIQCKESNIDDSFMIGNCLDELMELAEKSTPKKLIKSTDIGCINIYCPNCDLSYYPDRVKQAWIKYCPQCGQALDWSEYGKLL